MKTIRSLLPHILIVLSGIFMTFLVLDGYNPTMEFVNNPVSLKLLWVFCILSVLSSIVTIIEHRRRKKE